MSDSAEELAEEIRRAVPTAAEGAPDHFVLSRALSGMDRYVSPSVEPGVRFFRLKRLMLRALRLVTRPQATFNVRVLQGARDLERALLALKEERVRELADLRRDIDLLHARFSAAPASSGAAEPPRSEALPDGFYVRFEEKFRGAEAAVRERQQAYSEFFRGCPGTVLDCGCGRGEFLEVLAAAGVRAEGVDTNTVSVELAQRKKLSVRRQDLFERLRQAPGGFGGISALQLVEHLEPRAVFEFLRLAHEALLPGGLLLLETVNPDSVYALRAYRLDPTHRWPVPSQTLDLMAREAGFVQREVRFFSPVPEAERLEETNENDRKLNHWIFGPQDYALFAHRPR
jgi:O-antigen chain-terminating methyltransferase